jgi:hypothetical protein
MNEERRPFSVTDRRQFTSDGEPRSAEPEPAGQAAEETRGGGGGPAEGSSGGPESPRTPEDFAGLIAVLGVQGLHALGLASRPGAAPVDLREARAAVSLLESLEAKTEGRRTPEEDRLLASVLYELRMAYVARARGAGA